MPIGVLQSNGGSVAPPTVATEATAAMEATHAWQREIYATRLEKAETKKPQVGLLIFHTKSLEDDRKAWCGKDLHRVC